jgi:hypothetical protein
MLLETLTGAVNWAFLEGLISGKVLNFSNGIISLIRQTIFRDFITTESSTSFTRAASSQSMLRWIPGYGSYFDLYVEPDPDP